MFTHGFGACFADLSESGAAREANQNQPMTGGRHCMFIRLRNEFVYLAVVLDADSRRVIGWNLGRTLAG